MYKMKWAFLLQISTLILIIGMVVVFVCCFPMRSDDKKIWVVLVAGTKSYMNYRHQADVCHAYHIFRDNGIPSEQIVVMMYDDIAHSTFNPTPGIIVNVPNGNDVYHDVPINFSGDNVNVQSFIHVLLGHEDEVKKINKNGRVIQSGPNDHIIINFVDHGGPGFLSFPNELLHAADLRRIVFKMVEKQLFSKMLFLVEASYAGSMFDEVLSDFTNVHAITSSDVKEPSSACYYDETRQAYLSNEFSIQWMKHIERDSPKELLSEFYKKVRTNTIGSHVEDYGDLTVGNTEIENFFGKQRIEEKFQSYPTPSVDAVANPSVPAALIEQKLQLTMDDHKKNTYKTEMQALFQKRSIVDNILQRIVYHVVADGDPIQVDKIQNYNFPLTTDNMHCCKKVIDAFSKFCFNIAENIYVRSVAFMLVNMCSVDFTTTEDILSSIRSVCLGLVSEKIGIH